MRKLVWQYQGYLNRIGYDGRLREEMAYCSRASLSLYAQKCGADYLFCRVPHINPQNGRGGPSMERFQVFEEIYDKYDYVLNVDTDLLFHPAAIDLFSCVPAGVHIAGDNWVHRYDRELLENGWLSRIEDTERYRRSAIQASVILMSREFRQWIRSNCDPQEIDVDVGKKWPDDMSTIKWPVYDQSLLSYYIYRSPYDLFNLNQKGFINRNHVIHMVGRKERELMVSFFSRFSEIMSAWSCDLLSGCYKFDEFNS